jgi:aryl-alcohol dehydrogenase-like predicted oxidoreductase
MENRQLGRRGLRVSRLALGTMASGGLGKFGDRSLVDAP